MLHSRAKIEKRKTNKITYRSRHTMEMKGIKCSIKCFNKNVHSSRFQFRSVHRAVNVVNGIEAPRKGFCVLWRTSFKLNFILCDKIGKTLFIEDGSCATTTTIGAPHRINKSKIDINPFWRCRQPPIHLKASERAIIVIIRMNIWSVICWMAQNVLTDRHQRNSEMIINCRS